MVSNIKTELLYFNTQKDFEFEFNLCAACRMRLLTEEADSFKAFGSALTRAVSRSKIILILTEINEEYISALSKMIGFPTEEIDQRTFGITASPCSNLLSGSVPLVSSSGVLGGFILESGPQSLITVTRNKLLRDELISTFVEQYVKDVSQYSEADAETEPQSNDVAFLAEMTKIEPIEKADEFIAEAPTEYPYENIPEIAEDIFSASEQGPSDEIAETPDADFAAENEPVANDKEPTIVQKKPKAPINIPIIIMIIILIGLLGVIGYFLIIEPIINNISFADNIKSIFPFFQ